MTIIPRFNIRACVERAMLLDGLEFEAAPRGISNRVSVGAKVYGPPYGKLHEMTTAQELADEIKRLVDLYGEIIDKNEISCADVVCELHAAIDRLASLAAPQPAERKPLTLDQIIAATDEISLGDTGVVVKIARAIERAHGIGMPPDAKEGE